MGKRQELSLFNTPVTRDKKQLYALHLGTSEMKFWSPPASPSPSAGPEDQPLDWRGAPRAGRRRSSTRGAFPSLTPSLSSQAPGGGYPGEKDGCEDTPQTDLFPSRSVSSRSAPRVREKGVEGAVLSGRAPESFFAPEEWPFWSTSAPLHTAKRNQSPAPEGAKFSLEEEKLSIPSTPPQKKEKN